MTNINSSLTLCNYLIMSWMYFLLQKVLQEFVAVFGGYEKKYYFCSNNCINKCNEKVSYSNSIFNFFRT